MIYSVTGEIVLVEHCHVVVECNGIGYSVKTSMTTLSKLPSVGEKTTLFTYVYVREDILDLYGFYDKTELLSFKMLISISGVGPKAALAILSDLSPEKFALCVASGDSKALTVAQGIGPKTAQRIVLELKDKVAKEQVASGVIGGNIAQIQDGNSNSAEAITALEVLGYGRSDATQVVSQLNPMLSVEAMIKEGLKALASKL